MHQYISVTATLICIAMLFIVIKTAAPNVEKKGDQE
jgi:hypothetical protein